jgi:hypothetical protein
MQYILIHDRNETESSEAEATGFALERREAVATAINVPSFGPATGPSFGSSGASWGPSAAQHRRHRRTRADELLVKLRIGDGMLVARVEDISVGGLFAPTQRTVPYGAFVELALLRPGHDELPLTGVVVADGAQRAGLALRFEGVGAAAAAALRRVVLEQQVRAAGDDPDVDVSPTTPLVPGESARDHALDELRRKVALLQAENERLRAEVKDADAAHALVGRLRLEVERLRAGADHRTVVDAAALADLQRDAEQAWVAAARVADAVRKLG